MPLGATLPKSSASAAWVEEQVKKVRERTDKPFGVNIMMMNPHTPEIAEVIARLKVPAVTTGAGTPGPYIEMWKEAGVKVIPVISSAASALKPMVFLMSRNTAAMTKAVHAITEATPSS